ncbi:hypothetical protein HUG10_08120 [Halorarum halophilum]|uniref:Uncharacterized protein n=1 Tax=Halorarum halophilum TaxID=2743090 RepID=A0A7D5K7H5_9EURY|nr:hypothetical protein [Halobaculum halophilum]QLG27519.1 hypothetical protein HUG10_08120 [Halobaculum halophilum]
MFGDVSTSAFSGLQTVVLGVLLAALAGTLGLYVLGLPIEMTAVAFLVLFVGTLVLSIPLWKRVGPRFDHADRE